MFDFLITAGCIVIFVVAVVQLAKLIPAPAGLAFQIIFLAIAGICLLLEFGELIGKGPGVPLLQ